MLNLTSAISATKNNQSNDVFYLKWGYIFRVYFAPIFEVLGGFNNLMIILIVNQLNVFKKKAYKTRFTDKNSLNQSNQTNNSQISDKSSSISLSRSAIIYFTAIALTDTAVLWSSVFQRGWIIDVFNFDPTAISPASCKIYQFIFNFFLLGSSWLA